MIETETKTSTIIQVKDGRMLASVWELMAHEYMSRGGNLRDRTFDCFCQFLLEGGQVWAMEQNGEIVAALTMERLAAESREWVYINNGVVAEHLRRQKSGIMDQLLAAAISYQESGCRFVVITVVWGIFERLGFEKVDEEQLFRLDQLVGRVISAKLRHGKACWIGVKMPVFENR